MQSGLASLIQGPRSAEEVSTLDLFVMFGSSRFRVETHAPLVSIPPGARASAPRPRRLTPHLTPFYKGPGARSACRSRSGRSETPNRVGMVFFFLKKKEQSNGRLKRKVRGHWAMVGVV